MNYKELGVYQSELIVFCKALLPLLYYVDCNKICTSGHLFIPKTS